MVPLIRFLVFIFSKKRYPYLTRDELVGQLPVMRKRFSNFKSYADITMEDLFQNNELKDAGHLMADHMRTYLLFKHAIRKIYERRNCQTKFNIHLYIISITMDFNKDGKTDILLCGNNSNTKIRLGQV